MVKNLILTLFLLSLTWACGFTKGMDAARSAVDEFHRQVAAEQAGMIFDGATDHFRSSLSREFNRARFVRLRQKMGVCRSSQATSMSVNATNLGTFVSMKYSTRCANRQLDESFVWLIENEKARLYDYSASSPLLLVN